MWRRLLAGRNGRKRGPRIRDLLTRHLGGPGMDAQTIKHVIRPPERVNLQLALDHWQANNGTPARLVGFSLGSYHRDASLAQLLLSDDARVAPVAREQFPSGPGEHLDCVTQGLYLLHSRGRPVVVLLERPDFDWHPPKFELMAPDRETARAAVSDLLADAQRRTVYKGKTLYLEREEPSSETFLHFRELPPAPRDSIVLPERVLEVVERNVMGLFRHGEVLRRSGRSTRHGLLFHGPPGTGKTLMVRYLAHACPDHTVILLTGRQLGLIRESCQVARLLAPALVVLEDVDLVAQERSQNNCPVVLHELLDEMDGLGPKADCVFLLTTNRPEVLEPALAARPGRIDQAVEFPLPDADCRRRLFARYGEGLDLAGVDVERWVGRTDRASPAFIEELLRKAALMAAERGEAGTPLRVIDGDVERALHELVYFGGELTERLLGFRTFGYQAPQPK